MHTLSLPNLPARGDAAAFVIDGSHPGVSVAEADGHLGRRRLSIISAPVGF